MVLAVFLAVVGGFEVVSNLFHLRTMDRIKIGRSGRKQHREMPDSIGDADYFYKVVIMFACGVTFSIASVSLFAKLSFASDVAGFAVICFGLYGMIQAIVYRTEIKVWPAALAYNVPLVLWILKI